MITVNTLWSPHARRTSSTCEEYRQEKRFLGLKSYFPSPDQVRNLGLGCHCLYWVYQHHRPHWAPAIQFRIDLDLKHLLTTTSLGSASSVPPKQTLKEQEYARILVSTAVKTPGHACTQTGHGDPSLRFKVDHRFLNIRGGEDRLPAFLHTHTLHRLQELPEWGLLQQPAHLEMEDKRWWLVTIKLEFTPLLQYLECLLEKLEATVEALEGLRDNEERCWVLKRRHLLRFRFSLLHKNN